MRENKISSFTCFNALNKNQFFLHNTQAKWENNLVKFTRM